MKSDETLQNGRCPFRCKTTAEYQIKAENKFFMPYCSWRLYKALKAKGKKVKLLQGSTWLFDRIF